MCNYKISAFFLTQPLLFKYHRNDFNLSNLIQNSYIHLLRSLQTLSSLLAEQRSYTFLMRGTPECASLGWWNACAKCPGEITPPTCVCDQLVPCEAAISPGLSPSLLDRGWAQCRVFAPTASPHHGWWVKTPFPLWSSQSPAASHPPKVSNWC